MSAITAVAVQTTGTAQAIMETNGADHAVVTSTTEQVGTLTAAVQATSTARVVTLATERAHAEATATRQAEQTVTAVSIRVTAWARATATIRASNNAIATVQAPAVRSFGPSNGSLSHVEDGFVEDDGANVTLKNFIVDARFVNPYGPATGSWDYGFSFRHSEGDNQFRLSIHSNKSWILSNHTGDTNGDVIDSGEISDLRISAGQSNEIKLICDNNQGWFFVNNVFIAELNLSARSNSGDILVATGMYNGNEIDGEETRYTGFTVWSLP